MKINLNWLADYVDWTDRVKTDDLFELINRRLGEIKTVTDLGQVYSQARVASIQSLQVINPVANLQRLELDIGDSRSPVTVVCKADNLAPDQLVVYLAPGSRRPAGPAGPVIKQLTKDGWGGVVSNGVLASGPELGLAGADGQILDLGDDYAPVWADGPGLVKPQPGQSLADYFNLGLVIDIENKMFSHRPDCFGLIGLAREIAAITNCRFQSPDWYRLGPDRPPITETDRLALSIRAPGQVRRLQAALVDDLTVKPSALSVQSRLMSVGLKPINNLVDVSNYLMYLTAQPSHAFDWQALAGLSHNRQKPNLIGRLSQATDQLQLLDDRSIDWADDQEPSTVIAADKAPLALAGIIGGCQTAVTPASRRLVLEVANFDMASTWRTTMIRGLFTEAANRFSKGQSIYQTDPVCRFGAEMLAAVGGGKVLEAGLDCRSPDCQLASDRSLTVDLDFINRRLGQTLKAETVHRLLTPVGFEPLVEANQVIIKIPFWRTDIAIDEDLVEELGRLNGYENIRPVLPARDLTPAPLNQRFVRSDQIRRILARAGANELINYSFVSGRFLKTANQPVDNCFSLSNPLDPELKYYRPVLSPGLIAAAVSNQRLGFDDLAVFEIGAGHRLDGPKDQDQIPQDRLRLALVCSGFATRQPAFYRARRYLDLLGQRFNLEFDYQALPAGNQPASAATVLLDSKRLGYIGQKADLAGFEIELDPDTGPGLLAAIDQAAQTSHYRVLSRYPSSWQDLTLKVKLNQSYGSIFQSLKATLAQLCAAGNYQGQLELRSIYQPPDQTRFKQICWRLSLTDYHKTLTTRQVSGIRQHLIEAAAESHSASPVE